MSRRAGAPLRGSVVRNHSVAFTSGLSGLPEGLNSSISGSSTGKSASGTACIDVLDSTAFVPCSCARMDLGGANISESELRTFISAQFQRYTSLRHKTQSHSADDSGMSTLFTNWWQRAVVVTPAQNASAWRKAAVTCLQRSHQSPQDTLPGMVRPSTSASQTASPAACSWCVLHHSRSHPAMKSQRKRHRMLACL